MSKVVFGFESTSVYAEPLVCFMAEKPVKIVQVNPMHTKRVKELNDNSPNKTDNKDPRVIADIIRLGHFLSVVIPEGSPACLRQLSNARERKTHCRTIFINQLEHLISKIFPEFLKIISNVNSKTAQYLLNDYSIPQAFAGLDSKELGSSMKKISRGRFKEEQAIKIIQASKCSIGIRDGITAITMEIKQLIEQIEQCNKFIKCLEKEMEKELKNISISPKLLEIPGLGIVTVAGIIGEVIDFEKFGNQSEIIKLAGLDLFEVSSGKLKGKHRISKRGRHFLRKLLYFASINTVRKNGIMHNYYKRLTDKGMIKNKALTAVSRKLLTIIYAIARDKSNYEVDYTNHQNYKVAKAA